MHAQQGMGEEAAEVLLAELKHVIALTKPLLTGEASDDAATPQRTCILAQVEQNRFSIKDLLRLIKALLRTCILAQVEENRFYAAVRLCGQNSNRMGL